MNLIATIALFTVGYIAGVVTVVTWALMAASSEDSRRREREEESEVKNETDN